MDKICDTIKISNDERFNLETLKFIKRDIMTEFNMKCPECLHEFIGQSNNEFIVCPSCNKEINTNQAIKYHQSLTRIKNESIKVAEGEKYIQVNALLDECQWCIDNGDFDGALKITDDALKLSTVDGRIYLMRVYAKTKNFTDYEENTHFSDLKQALELSTTIEKANIKKIYSTYHKKRNIPKEELDEYENQEADSKLVKVESLLKDGIPKHFSREKSLKSLKPLTAISIALCVILLAISLILNNSILSIITATIFTLAFILFTVTHTAVKRVNVFNSILDLYDTYKQFNLTPRTKLNLSKELEKFAVCVLNSESISQQEAIVYSIVELLTQNAKALEFITENKTLKKFI